MTERERAYRELAERLLTPVTGWEDGPVPRARLYAGELPPDLPVAPPIPPGARTVGSAVIAAPDWADPSAMASEVRVALEFSGAPEAAVEAVVEQAAAAGWFEPERHPHELGGFISGPHWDRLRWVCHSRHGPSLHIAASESAPNLTDLRLTLRGGDGICHSFPGGPGAERILPTLRPPRGLRLRGEGGGGGGSSWYTSAMLIGEPVVTSLLEHFDQQMAEAGWEPVAQSASAEAATSIWIKAGEWTATLLIVAIPAGGGLPGRRWLHLRADMVAGSDAAAAGFSFAALGE